MVTRVRRLTAWARSPGVGGMVAAGEVVEMPDELAALHIRNGDAIALPEEPAPAVDPPAVVEVQAPEALAPVDPADLPLVALRAARAEAARIAAHRVTPTVIRRAFVDLPEAARRTGIPERTLRRLLARGDVPGHRAPHSRARWQVPTAWVLEVSARHIEGVASSLTRAAKV